MNDDDLKGLADKAAGNAKSAVGSVTGNRQLQAEGALDQASGAVRDAISSAKDAANDAGQTISAKARELSDKARESIEDGAVPLVREVGDKTMEYGREARDAIAASAASASRAVRSYPFVTFGLVAALGFLLGRMTAPEQKSWYRRDWH